MRDFVGWVTNLLKPPQGYAEAVPTAKKAVGEPPKISFKAQIDAYNRDTAVRAFVDVLAMQTVGMGFYTTCTSEEEYNLAPEAKAIADAFNEKNNVDDVLQVTTREIVGTGNGIWQLFDPKKVERVLRVPIVSFERAITNEFLEFEETVWTKQQKLQLGFKQTSVYGGKLVPAENLLHFRWNPIDNSGWGCGIMRVLMEELSWQEYDKNTGQYVTRTRPSFLEIKGKLDLDLIEVYEKFAGPLEAWVTEDKVLGTKIQSELTKTPKYGGRLVASGKGGLEIKTAPMEPRARFMESIDYLWNQFCLGGESPLPKLFTTPGFTEASARAAVDIADRLVLPLQRLIKRNLEMLWAKVIVGANEKIDPMKAGVRLNWGSPEMPEIVVADLLKAAELGFVRPEEFRKNAVKFGWELWEAQTFAATPASKTQQAYAYRFVVVGDGTCEKCNIWAGQIFSEAEAIAAFPNLEKNGIWHPHIHPGCRCRLYPLFEATEAAKAATPSDNTHKSEGGGR